jgi:glucose/mannose transport system permease protein
MSAIARRKGGVTQSAAARLILVPSLFLVVTSFYLGLVFTGYISLTRSSIAPDYTLAGWFQYVKLFTNPRWLTAYKNMFIFGTLFVGGALVLGTLLAIAIDQRVRAESLFRTIFLYPLSISFIITGLAWQWILKPSFGIQGVVRGWGWESFTLDWIARSGLSIYTLVLAALWHSSGLVMAIMLAGLRGIDEDIWKASRMEGIPRWRAYLSIIIPMLRPMVLTCVVLLSASVIKSYDLVVAMTAGGPGYSSDLPAKFVVDLTFERTNLGMASAGAIVMLVTLTAALAPYFYLELRKRKS